MIRAMLLVIQRFPQLVAAEFRQLLGVLGLNRNCTKKPNHEPSDRLSMASADRQTGVPPGVSKSKESRWSAYPIDLIDY